MFEMTGKKKLAYMDHNQGTGAAYKPYSRSAVAKKRKGKSIASRGFLGHKKLTMPPNGGKQPIGAKPVSTRPTDSLSRQKWFQT